MPPYPKAQFYSIISMLLTNSSPNLALSLLPLPSIDLFSLAPTYPVTWILVPLLCSPRSHLLDMWPLTPPFLNSLSSILTPVFSCLHYPSLSPLTAIPSTRSMGSRWSLNTLFPPPMHFSFSSDGVYLLPSGFSIPFC